MNSLGDILSLCRTPKEIVCTLSWSFEFKVAENCLNNLRLADDIILITRPARVAGHGEKTEHGKWENTFENEQIKN